MLVNILGYYGKSPTKIADMKVDLVRSVDYQYEQTVTEHPIETGFEIHDTIINKPLRMDMSVIISTHPVTWYQENGAGAGKIIDGIDALEKMRDAKMPLTIVRPNKIYTDMVMTSCKISKSDESKSNITAELSFLKITKVEVETTDIPENIVSASAKESAGETAKDDGSAQTAEESPAEPGEETGEESKKKEEVKQESWYHSLYREAKEKWFGG